jgi:hypothetical protein
MSMDMAVFSSSMRSMRSTTEAIWLLLIMVPLIFPEYFNQNVCVLAAPYTDMLTGV